MSLYEQFLAVGSVKSLLTGKEISVPQSSENKTSLKDQPSDQPLLKDAADIQQ